MEHESMADKISGTVDSELTEKISSLDISRPSLNDIPESKNTSMCKLTKEMREQLVGDLVLKFLRSEAFGNTEDEKNSAFEEVINLTTKEMNSKRPLIGSKTNCNHEATYNQDDDSKLEECTSFDNIPCKNVVPDNVVSFKVEQDWKKSLHDISDKASTKETECTIEHSGQSENENFLINLADDSIAEYDECIQSSETIDVSTQSATKALSDIEIIDLTYSDCSNSSQEKSTKIIPTEKQDEVGKLIMLLERFRNFSYADKQKEAKQQDNPREVYFGNDGLEKHKENIMLKCQEKTIGGKILVQQNEISKEIKHDGELNEKVKVSTKPKDVTDSKNTNCSDLCQVECSIILRHEDKTVNEKDNIVLESVQDLSGTDKQEEFEQDYISKENCTPNEALEKKNKNITIKCQEKIHGKKTTSQQNQIFKRNNDSSKVNSVHNEPKELEDIEVIDLISADLSSSSELDNTNNTIELSTEEEAEFEKSIILLESGIENLCYGQKENKKQQKYISVKTCNENNSLQKELKQSKNKLRLKDFSKDQQWKIGCNMLSIEPVKETIQNAKQNSVEEEKNPISSLQIDKQLCKYDFDGSKIPMEDDEKGKFFIDKELLFTYQEGLSKMHWNPTQVLYELCSQCQWSAPEFSLFDYNADEGFLFSVRINEHTFIPQKRGRTKKQAKHCSSSHFLNFIGFKFTFDDPKTLTNTSSPLPSNSKWEEDNKWSNNKERSKQGHYSSTEKENYKGNFAEDTKCYTRCKYDSRQSYKKLKHNSYNRHRSSSESSSESTPSEYSSHRCHSEMNRRPKNKKSTILMSRRHVIASHPHEFTPRHNSDPPSYYQRDPPLPYHRLPPPHYPRTPSPSYSMGPPRGVFGHRNIPPSERSLHRPVYFFL